MMTHKSNLPDYDKFQHECYTKEMYNLYSWVTTKQDGDLIITIPSVCCKMGIL
jgi:hypothetical protein